MNATPITLERQLKKVSLIKAAVAAAPRVAYSTQTGDEPRPKISYVKSAESVLDCDPSCKLCDPLQ